VPSPIVAIWTHRAMESYDARPRTVHRMPFAVPATTDVRLFASRFLHEKDRTLHSIESTRNDGWTSFACKSVRCTRMIATTMAMSPEQAHKRMMRRLVSSLAACPPVRDHAREISIPFRTCPGFVGELLTSSSDRRQ